MIERLDDITLVAYVDGELDLDQTRAVEQALVHDPEAQLKVRRMRETGALLRAACSEMRFQDDVPDAFVQLVQQPAAPVPRHSGKWALAIALAMFLVAMAGVYLVTAGRGPEQADDGRPGIEDVAEEIVDYHIVYSQETKHLVEVPADQTPEIEAWLGGRLNRTLRVPDLTGHDLNFEGARLLVVNEQPVAQLLYTRAQGAPIAVCITFSDTATMPLDVSRRRGLNVGTWSTAGYLYVVVGALPEDHLRRIAADVEDQMRKS